MNHTRIAPWLALLVLVSGCAQLGLAPAQNFSGRLAYGYSTYTAVNNTIASSLDAQRISSADARNMVSIAREARAALDGAKSVYAAGNLADASNRLLFALGVLERLQEYLDKQGAKP